MVENTATVFHTNSGLITLKGDNLDNLDVQEERGSKESDFIHCYGVIISTFNSLSPTIQFN